MKHLAWLALLIVSGCVNVNTQADSEPPGPETAIKASPPPQLWSDHLRLQTSAKNCGQLGLRALQSLSHTQTVRQGDFAYGVFGANRSAVKCVEDGDEAFVYIMVAGPDKKVVERLRNELVRVMRSSGASVVPD